MVNKESFKEIYSFLQVPQQTQRCCYPSLAFERPNLKLLFSLAAGRHQLLIIISSDTRETTVLFLSKQKDRKYGHMLSQFYGGVVGTADVDVTIISTL